MQQQLICTKLITIIKNFWSNRNKWNIFHQWSLHQFELENSKICAIKIRKNQAN